MCSFILEIVFQYLLKIYLKLVRFACMEMIKNMGSTSKGQKKKFKVDSSRRATKTIGRLVFTQNKNVKINIKVR